MTWGSEVVDVRDRTGVWVPARWWGYAARSVTASWYRPVASSTPPDACRPGGLLLIDQSTMREACCRAHSTAMDGDDHGDQLAAPRTGGTE